MGKHLIATAVCSAFGLIGMSGVALADTIGRYECSVIGALAQEPIGDRNEHTKGAVNTGISISEWDGPKGTYLASIGLHRAPGGFAIGQLLEGTGSIVMKDGKVVGSEGSGKTLFKFASGTLAAISGKTVKWTSKPVGLGRFELEFTD